MPLTFYDKLTWDDVTDAQIDKLSLGVIIRAAPGEQRCLARVGHIFTNSLVLKEHLLAYGGESYDIQQAIKELQRKNPEVRSKLIEVLTIIQVEKGVREAVNIINRLSIPEIYCDPVFPLENFLIELVRAGEFWLAGNIFEANYQKLDDIVDKLLGVWPTTHYSRNDSFWEKLIKSSPTELGKTTVERLLKEAKDNDLNLHRQIKL